jgi:hypothetical protein
MKRSTIIGIIILAGALVSLIAWALLRGYDLEDAIDRYESGRHLAAIDILGRLQRTADYDAGEKIYYYRCRALNGLAEELEKKYDDELRAVAADNADESGREKERKYIETKLAKINDEIGADLALVIDKKRGRIVSRGKFYDEFVARYKGSRYIEDLDYEELRKVERLEPGRLLGAIAGFYARYPSTIHLGPIVRMIFSVLEEGSVTVKEKESIVKELVIEYVRRYPTSAEVQRLFTCAGDDVNLRNSPGIEGQIVGKIARDEVVLQLEKSMDTAQVGDVRDHWYRVAAMGGLRGWIFGKFLRPIEVIPYAEDGDGGSWAVEDRFAEWDDSYTPKNWMHMENADRSSVSFAGSGGAKILRLNAVKGKTTGLFRRFDPGTSFALNMRARMVAGDSVVLFAKVLGGGKVYALVIRGEEIELSGRKIPLHTADWHDYTVESADGGYARLLVDGEPVLSRIPPSGSQVFSGRGIYCLYTDESEAALVEVEYVRMR